MKRYIRFHTPRPGPVRAVHLGSVLPAASLTEGTAVRFNLEVDFRALLLGVMFGGFVLAVADWLAEMLVMRPWFTGLAGWAIGALTIGAWFDLSQPIWWWFIVKGLLVGVPAFVSSWLVKRMQSGKAQRPA